MRRGPTVSSHSQSYDRSDRDPYGIKAALRADGVRPRWRRVVACAPAPEADRHGASGTVLGHHVGGDKPADLVQRVWPGQQQYLVFPSFSGRDGALDLRREIRLREVDAPEVARVPGLRVIA